MTVREFALPDVGEGLTEAEIVAWRVTVGDEVSVNQTIVDIETAKAVVELPSPFGGRVVGLLVEAGRVVPVGTPILAVEVNDREPVLIGYGVAQEQGRRRRLRRAAAVEAPNAPQPGRPLAKPPVRALARSLGVDLETVLASGPHGDITREDVERAAHPATSLPAGGPSGMQDRRAGQVAVGSAEPPRVATSLGDRIPVRGVRRAMAEAMVRSLEQAPHVTEWVDADVTGTVRLVERLRRDPEFSGSRITPLTVAAAAVVRALRRTPIVNSTWHDLPDGSAEIEVHRHVNLGLAVASPRGLVVPNIPGADRMSLQQLAWAITRLTERAREGSLTPGDSVGGTITITNVGVFGVDGGTPILNPGEAAILAMGRVLERPWVVSGGLTVRPVMELTLSFDHRIVDGAAGSTFLADVAALLSDPRGIEDPATG